MVPFHIKIAHVLNGPNGRDPRVRRTVDFFARKGYLINLPISASSRQPLDLADVLWACAHAVPELYEVVPIARLRFPKKLSGRPPQDLQIVLDALKAGTVLGPDYHGHPWARVRAWVDFATKDRRVTPTLTQPMVYKLSPALIARVKMAAEHAHQTPSAFVSEAVRAALAQIKGS